MASIGVGFTGSNPQQSYGLTGIKKGLQYINPPAYYPAPKKTIVSGGLNQNTFQPTEEGTPSLQTAIDEVDTTQQQPPQQDYTELMALMENASIKQKQARDALMLGPNMKPEMTPANKAGEMPQGTSKGNLTDFLAYDYERPYDTAPPIDRIDQYGFEDPNAYGGPEMLEKVAKIGSSVLFGTIPTTIANQALNPDSFTRQSALKIVNAFSPSPEQGGMSPAEVQAVGEASKSFGEHVASSEASGGGLGAGEGGCCFIFIASHGFLHPIVREYRDHHMTTRNRRGYYWLADKLVPWMKKSKLATWLVKWLMVKPMTCYGKYYYNLNRIGAVYAPVTKFWLTVYSILGMRPPYTRKGTQEVV